MSPFTRGVCSFASIIALCFAASAQAAAQSKIPPYNPPTVYTPTKMNLYTSYCGLWRTDKTYTSTIRLSNQLSISAMDATVTVFLADGTPYVLPPVHLEKSGVATVDINAALAAAPATIKTHLSTFGSASVSYRYDWQGAVYGFMSILDTLRSLEYTYPFMFPMSEQMGMTAPAGTPPSTTFEGLHWGYSAQSSVFLSFSNTTKQPLNASVSLLDGKGTVTMSQSLVIASLNTALLTGLPTSTTPGGVLVTWNGDENALAVLGGIEDAKYGYSANIPFSMVPMIGPADLTTVQTTYASPGIMVGTQDPMMGFPAGLTFQPYAYFRNISGQPMKLSAHIVYAKGSLPLPDTIVPPHSSYSPSLENLIQPLGLNGSITLIFSYSGLAGALLASTGSVDSTGNYVFDVEAHPSGQSAGKSSIFWTTANGFDTMYSIWNATNQEQDLLATFQLGKGQTYLYPVHLPASGTAMIDVKEIAQMGAPDQNGNTMPVSVTRGRVSISAASGKPVDPINVVISGGIYNPTKATCGYTCETCDGCSNFDISPDPFDGTYSELAQLYAQCTWTDGTLYDYTNVATWSSSDTSIVTVETSGDSQPGLANPVGAGNAYLQAVLPSEPVSMGQICASPPLPSCQYTQAQPTTPGTMIAPYQIIFAAEDSSQPNVCSQGAGWFRAATLQIADQNGKAFPLQTTVSDTIAIGTPNDLGIGGSQTGGIQTNSQGQWIDDYAVCSAACPSSTGKTVATQQWSTNTTGLLKTNAIVYTCGSITFDGH